MNDRKSLLICIGLFIISLLLGIGCYYGVSLFTNNMDNEIVDNNKDNIDVGKNENIFTNDDVASDMREITLNDDNYLWKMKVSNQDGAYVYENGYVNCNNSSCDRSDIVFKLEYGTEINVIGDFVYENVLVNENMDYDNFILDDIKDYYSVMISYTMGGEKYQIGYVNYNDVTLMNENNFNSNEYDVSKKYYVSNNLVYMYDGPGLLYEKENMNFIPSGEILEVKYYNQIFSRNWLYVTYKDYSGWVMQCRYNSVNEPYSIVINNCVDEITEESGKLKINQDNVYLYKDTNGEEKIAVIYSGSEITYDYKLNVESGIVKFHTNYNGVDGYIIGLEVSKEECNNSNDGKLYIMWQEDGSIRTCE